MHAVSTNELASAKAYRILRNAILTLELRPGQYLRESDLVSNYQLGRTPIREALHKLASEHLVELRPGSGSHVTEVTLSDVGDIFEMRETLTPLEVRLALRCSNQPMLDKLREQMDNMNETQQPYEMDLEFHSVVASMTENTYLIKTLEMLSVHSIRMFRVTRAPRMPVIELIEGHLELGEAVIAGDLERATELSLDHVRDSKKRLLDAL